MKKTYDGKCLYLSVWTVVFAWFIKTFFPKMSVEKYTLKGNKLAKAFLPGYKKECAIIDKMSSNLAEMAKYVGAREWSSGVVLYCIQKYNISITVTNANEFDAIVKLGEDCRILEALNHYTPSKMVMVSLLKMYAKNPQMREKIVRNYPNHFYGLSDCAVLSSEDKLYLCEKNILCYSECLMTLRNDKVWYNKFFIKALKTKPEVLSDEIRFCVKNNIEAYKMYADVVIKKHKNDLLAELLKKVLTSNAIRKIQGAKVWVNKGVSKERTSFAYKECKRLALELATLENVSYCTVELAFNCFYENGDKEFAKDFISKFKAEIWNDAGFVSVSLVKRVSELNPCLKDGQLLKNVLFDRFLTLSARYYIEDVYSLYPFSEFSPELQLRAIRWILARQFFQLNRVDELSLEMKEYVNEFVLSYSEIINICMYRRTECVGALKQYTPAMELALVYYSCMKEGELDERFYSQVINYIETYGLSEAVYQEVLATKNFYGKDKIIEAYVLKVNLS